MTTHITPAQALVDEIRALQARVHGKQLELCMALGDRAGAQHHQREMLACVEARRATALMRAEQAGECYFTAAGSIYGQEISEGETHGR